MDGEGEAEGEPEPEDNSETIERVLGNRRGKKGGIINSIKSWLLLLSKYFSHYSDISICYFNLHFVANTMLNFS